MSQPLPPSISHALSPGYWENRALRPESHISLHWLPDPKFADSIFLLSTLDHCARCAVSGRDPVATRYTGTASTPISRYRKTPDAVITPPSQRRCAGATNRWMFLPKYTSKVKKERRLHRAPDNPAQASVRASSITHFARCKAAVSAFPATSDGCLTTVKIA